MLDLIGPDLQAFTPPHRTKETLDGQHSNSAGIHTVHERFPQLCKACRLCQRSIRVRLHACGYEAAALHCMPDPDITCMFHPGLAAEQPQCMESAANGKSARQVVCTSAASPHDRKRWRCSSSGRHRVSRNSESQGSIADNGQLLEEMRVPFAPRGLGQRRAAVGKHVSSGHEAMPSLKQAWAASLPLLASLTCPLLVTAFSMAGAQTPLAARLLSVLVSSSRAPRM